MPDAIELLKTRRSMKPREMTGPGPSPADLETILTIGARVPDHGKLAPWRFIVIEGAGRGVFGDLIARVWAKREPDAAPPDRLALERARFAQVPVVVVLVSRAAEHPKISIWEQELSAGAVGMLFVVAANAMGYAATWNTGWFAYDREVMSALGLSASERIAGIIGIGTAGETPERTRPSLADIVSRWGA